MFERIAIIGVGLIGGSIGLAVRKNRLAAKVMGIGRRKVSIARAIRRSAIDAGTLNLKQGIKGADLIIIATPVDKVEVKIAEVAKYAEKGVIIIDVNSTKQGIVSSAERCLPKDMFFVGTHPIAGSEQTGIFSSDAGLFKGSICIVTPTSRTDRKVLEKVKSFWKNIGAEVRIMSPKLHDDTVAAISHLPHILAYALCNTVSSKELKMAGTGFKDATRIARSNPRMWEEIFIQNQKSLLKSVTVFQKNLNAFKDDIIKKRRTSLSKRLILAKRKRDVLG
jgi:prephenate dehydrogenase